MFVFTRSSTRSCQCSHMTRLTFTLFSVEKRGFILFPVIIAATVGRLQRLLSLASSKRAQPFLELLFVSAPSARRHCRTSSSTLPRFQIFSSIKKIHHSFLIGRSLLRPHLVPKNFHLEKCVFPFGHIYGALNVIKQ